VEAGFSKTNQIILFPNPAHDRVNLSVYAEFAEILDISGRSVTTFSGNSVGLQNIPAGVYFVRIQANGLTSVSPLVISN
jgi:hypothetical protein